MGSRVRRTPRRRLSAGPDPEAVTSAQPAAGIPQPDAAAPPGEQQTPPVAAAQPPQGTQPLTRHTRWAGNLRPERLLYADGTPLTIRGQGEDGDQALPATAAGVIPAPAGSDYGPGRLQVVRWDDGRYQAVHPALASPAGTDPYGRLSDRDRARWEAFDRAEAWPTTTAGLLPHLVDPGDILEAERGPRSRVMDRLEIEVIEPGTGPYTDGLEFKVRGRKSPLFYPGNTLVPVCIPLDHPALEAAVQAKSTLEKYTRPDGTLDPERQRLHDQIVEHALAGHQPQPHPVATFFGGGPASGKSALQADTPDNVRIDADAIKQMLPEYQQMLHAADARAAAYVHEESSALAKRIANEAQRRRYNYIHDGTGDTSFQKMAAKVAKARAAGYSAAGKYVTVDTDTAVQRARKRSERTGRMVPESVIRAIHACVSDTFAQAADQQLFDTLELLDNNEAGGRKVIARDDGAGLRVPDPAAYDRFLAKGEDGGYAREHRGAGGTPPASEAGEIGLSAARSTGHPTGPETVGPDRPGPGRHAGAGPAPPRPLGLQRGLTTQQPRDLASNPLEPRGLSPGTGKQRALDDALPPGQRVALDDLPVLPTAGAGTGRATGTPDKPRAADHAAGTAQGRPAHASDTGPAEAPVNNSDLAMALRRLPGFTSLLTQAGPPARGGSHGWREPGAPDAGASQDVDCGPSGIEITIRGPGFRRHSLLTWPQVASWIDPGVTPARLGIIITADRLSMFCHTRRDDLATAGRCDPDAARAELDTIRDQAINTVINAALRTRGAAAPVPPAGPGSPAYCTAAMITRPDEAASREENTVLERLNQLRTQIREPQPVTPQEVKAMIRRWIGAGLPNYVRVLGQPGKMRAWITGQARGPASRPSRVTYDTPGVPGGRWYGASPEGLLTAVGSDDRAETLITWEEIPAWVQPGITTTMRDRLLAAADASSAVFHRLLTAAVHPDAGLDAPTEDEDEQAAQRRNEAVDAAWSAIEAAPPPSPAELDHARHLYRDTSSVQQTLFGDPPQDSTHTQPADPAGDDRESPPAELRHARTVHGSPGGMHELLPGSPGTADHPAALPQATRGPVPLTGDDICLGLSRLPAVVIGNLVTAIDTRQPLEPAGRQLAPYSGKRSVREPDPGARETVTAEPAGLRIQVTSRHSSRTGLITWPQIDDLLRPGLTPARRQIVVQATQVRLRFAAANASFRAIGEGRLAAAAEDQLRADARAAVDAILATVRPGGGQAPRPADEAATIERIAELATALPGRPPQPRTPAGQLATGDIIGHPGYRFQPFRLSAPPRHTEAGIEITGRLADPSDGEPTGQITLRLTRAGRPEPVVCLIPPPARPLRSLPGRSAATQGHHGPDDIRDDDNRPGVTAQPSAGHGQAPATAQRPHDSPAGTAAAGSAVMTPGTATPGPSGGNGSSQPPGTAPPPIQKDTMPPAPSATSPPQAETEPAARAAPAARPAPAARKPVAQPAPASQSRPGSQAADDAQLLHELDHVLAAITERRRAAAAPPGTDGASFADIRAAFTVLRRALDLPGPGDNGNGARPSATVSGAAHPTSTPIRAAHDGAVAAPGEFSDIRAAFASLRDVLGLPAPSGQDRPSAPGPDGATRPDTGRLLDQAAAEAHTCARWYRDTPEWQRMSRIGRAARELLTAIRETAADYWAEIRHDIRVRGFARTLAVRVSLTVSGTARLLTGRLERAGHRGTRPWRAAWRLHQAAAAFAGRIMNDTPPGGPARMDEARRIINDLGRGTHRPAGPEPSRAAARPAAIPAPRGPSP